MENIPTVRKHVDNLATQVPALQALLDPIVHGVVPASLSPLDQAQHYALLAYALDSVIFACLKSTGADTKEHPIMIELERIKAALARIKRVEEGGEDKEEKRPARIDKEAAERIIAHGTGRKPRHTVFDKDGKMNPDEYLHKMAVESEKAREAKANPVEISDDDNNANQKPEEQPARKKAKSSKSKKSKS